MKKLIAISSLLVLVAASSGLFAYDILNGDGEKSGFALEMEARYGIDILTENAEPATMYEEPGDPQAKVKVGVSYDGDNYAFGLGAGWEKRYTNEDGKFFVDKAWGKYYFLEKQFWLRAGTVDGLWRIDTDPLNKNYAGDNGGPGLQLNLAPKAINGLNVGFALPVPIKGNRLHVDAEVREDGKEISPATDFSWNPAYPFANMVFGLRLNGTIPNLDFGTELRLRGNESTNGKTGDDEGEGLFKGVNFHFTTVYTIKAITIKAALVAEEIGDRSEAATNTKLWAGAQLGFDIPNGIPNVDLGDPWVSLVMKPNANANSDGETEADQFADMDIAFEWEPNYSIIPDKIKALLWFGMYYSSWADATDAQKDYPMEVAVQPKVEFKFAPNATISVFNKVTLVQKKTEDGLKNQLGFRFNWGF
jgi:hypothetical protein